MKEILTAFSEMEPNRSVVRYWAKVILVPLLLSLIAMLLASCGGTFVGYRCKVFGTDRTEIHYMDRGYQAGDTVSVQDSPSSPYYKIIVLNQVHNETENTPAR